MAGYAATRQSGAPAGLGWLSIVRLGLVQASLGSIVVLTTSVLNRVMVVELMLAAVIPGPSRRIALWRADLEAALGPRLRPRRPAHAMDCWRHSCCLPLSGTAASATTLLFGAHFWLAMGLAIVSFILHRAWHRGCRHVAAGACLPAGPSLHRKPAAATIVWMMMIAGIVVTAIISGAWLDPFSFERSHRGDRHCRG
jgi:BCD family chlorophyll transporter-like MFS transporter